MNIPLPLAATLLLPASHLALGTQETVPKPPAARTAATENHENEIIRQYSIYMGLQTVYGLQRYAIEAAAMSPADLDIVRRSAHDHLGTAIDQKALDAEYKHISQAYMTALREEETERDKTFMQENAKRPGVVSLPIGIQYKVIPDPEGNNRTLDEMNGYMETTSSGRCIGGISTHESHDFSYVLPNILTDSAALQNMPKGKEFIFYIPIELLSPSKRKDEDDRASIIIYIFRHQHAGGSFWRQEDVQAQAEFKRIPPDLLRKHSELLGASVAHYIQSRWTEDATQEIDRNIVKQTISDHISDTIDPAALRNEYKDVIRQYTAIQEKRQKERDRIFMQEHAKRPGIIDLGNGIQYAVEKDPANGNLPFTSARVTNIATISGTKNCQPSQNDLDGIEDFGMPDMLGESLKQIEPGYKWTFYLSFQLLPDIKRQLLTNLWKGACPEYVAVSCVAAQKETDSSNKDEDIEDDATEKPSSCEDVWKRQDRSPEAMARDEEHFLRLLDLTPNVTVLPNGVRYASMIDPEGRNGSIKNVSIMTPHTLAGDSFGSHLHLDHQNTRPDGTEIYTHPLIEPYIDDLPEAKKWFFCIPSSLLDPADVEWYEQRIGVRPNYILYTLEANTTH